jgi:hypothetical protein
MNNLEILRKFVSTQGYKKDSPDKNNPYNIIPSNQITMENVDFPVMGISMETQEKKIMLPNQDYTFDNTKNVIEFPIRQQGGTAGMDGMIKARLAIDSHFGNPTAKRMTNYDTRSYEFPDGNKGNVYVSSYDNLVTPQIQDVNGKLMFIDNPWSEENADRSYNQSMKFEREEDARYFGENYKKYAPMMNLYQQGGEMNEEIMNQVAQAIQQGANPDEIVQALIQQGLGEPEAMQLVNNVMSQLETQLPQAQYGMQVTNHNKVSNLNFGNPLKFDFNNSQNLEGTEKFKQNVRNVGQGIKDYYKDNTFGERVNRNALTLNSISDPRNLTWALPDKGIGSGFKAISGLASGLTGAYLGYAKMFSKDKTRYFDPKEKPIVSSPYIPEGKDVTNIVKPSSNVPTWDWQTQHPDLTAANMAGKASYTVPNKDNTVNNWYNAPGQNTIGPVEFAKGGMKKYQLGQQVDSSMYDFNIESLIPQGYYDFPYPYGKEIQSTNNIQNPWAMQYGDNTNPNPPRQYTRDTVPEQMQRQSYQNYFPGATVDEGSIAMDNYTNQNIYPTNSVNPSNKTSEQLKKEKKYITSRGDSLGFQVANNALIGFQNFNDVLSAKDYEKEYNQMLIDTGNTDQRYNTNNPTNPYGTYTPNVGIGSNYGLVANGPIQDFGTGKFGGMTMAQNGGPKYDIKDPRNPNYKPDYPKKTCGINNNKCYTADGVSKNRDAFISNRSTRTTKNKNINKSKEQQLAYNYNRSTRTTENKNINKSKEQQLAYNYNIPIIVEPDSLQPNIQNNINQRPQKYYKNVRGTIQETTANDPYAMSYEEAMQKNNSITHSNQGSSMSGKDNLFVYQEGGDTLFYNGHTYKLAMEEYKRLQNTPEAWKGDPDFEDENGNLKICVDCLNVDYTNDSDIRDIYTLIKEGYAKEPHYSANEYQAGLIKLGLPTKKFGGMKKKYKEGGQYTLSQEEIDYIINNGGEIEFID